MVASANLPSISDKEYKNPFVICATLLMMLGQLGPFFGIFFGTKGPNGEWPYAWWSFCFFGNAFGSLGWFGSSQVYSVTRMADEFILRNMYGSVIERIRVADIVSVEEKQNWCGKYISIKKTQELVEQQRAKAGCCKYCFCESTCFQLKSADYARFVNDHKLEGSATVMGKFDA